MRGVDMSAPFVQKYWSWMPVGELQLDFAFQLDQLSMVMILIVTGVSTLIHVFSTGYMRDDPGFARGLKPVRVAGLIVAGLAVAKVTFSDLAALDALYRVASVFILGLVSLSLAYLYHRQARRDEPAAAPAADEALP